MTLPPAILDLSIATRTGRHIRLWLPIFLLWPLVLALGVFGVALALLADAVLVLLGRSYHLTSLLIRALAALGATRGTAIRITNETSAVAVTVK